MHDCVVAADAARLCVGNYRVAVGLVVREDVQRQRFIPGDKRKLNFHDFRPAKGKLSSLTWS